MPTRQEPISRVKRGAADTRYTRDSRGYGVYDIMAERAAKMQDYTSGTGEADYTGMIPNYWETSGGSRIEPAVQFVPAPVNAMIVSPWRDSTAQNRMDLTAFRLTGDFTTDWCDWLRGLDGNAMNWMWNAQPPITQGTEKFTGVISEFALPRNPMFAVRLWRALPGEELENVSARQLATTMRFGELSDTLAEELEEDKGADIRIALPYDGPIRVEWRHETHTGNKWVGMLGDTRALSWTGGAVPKNMPNGQFVTIWVACLRSGIVISSDRFQDDFMYMRFPIVETAQSTGDLWAGWYVDGEVPDVSAGLLRLEHNAGLWCFSFVPLRAGNGDIAELVGPLHRVGHAKPTLYAEETFCQARARNKLQPGEGNDEAYIAVADVSGTSDAKRATGAAGTEKFREWRARFIRHRWEHSFTRLYGQCPMQQYQDGGADPLGLQGTFTCDVSPELYAVSMGEFPTVSGSGSIADAEVPTTARTSYSSPPDAAHAECKIVLDNMYAENRELRDEGAREVTVEMGYELDDDTSTFAPMLTGIVMDPVATEEAVGLPAVTFSVTDFAAILSRARADASLPCFDGWKVWQALRFLLLRAGFAHAEMGIMASPADHFFVDMTDVTKGIEDSRKSLSMGPPERPLWRADTNAMLLTMIRKIAEHDHDAAVWFHPDGTFTKGCRYCRRRRDGSSDEGVHHPKRHDEPNASGCLAYDVVRAGNASGIDHELYSPGSELIADGATLIGSEIRSLRVWNITGDQRKFANRVLVTAPQWSGANTLVGRIPRDTTDDLSALDYDLASIETPSAQNYAHGEVMWTEDAELMMSQNEVNRRARELLKRLSAATEHVEVELPMNPWIMKGHVFRIHGGDIGVNVRNHVYRVLYAEHRAPTQGAAQCSTSIGGVYLRTEAP